MSEFVPVEPDVLVFALASLLYLADLGRLLRTNEVLLVRGTGGAWRAVTPTNGFLFNRRYAVFPKWFDPGSIVLRFRWPGEARDASRPADAFRRDVESIQHALRLPRALCLSLLPTIFIAIPVCYSLPDNRLALLVVLLWIYLQILVLVGWLVRRRKVLGISWKSSLALAVEVIVCIPYAINFHRKVADRAIATDGVDLLRAGGQLLADDRLERLREHLRVALDPWLARQPADSALSGRLIAMREQLQREPPHEPE